MTLRSSFAFLFAAAFGVGACSSVTSEEDAEAASSDAEVNSAPACNPMPVRATPEPGDLAGLSASADAPMPELGPDADGFFHPPVGYTEGGTFGAPDEAERWAVAPRDVAARPPAGTIRVAEWNVERGNELDKTVRVMKKINADVWLLNETDLFGMNSGGVVVARELARALGYSYYTGIEFYERRDDRRGTSGNAIVSRFPLRDVRSIAIPDFADEGGHDWSTSRSEPRCGQRNALGATVDVEGASGETRSVRLVSLHTENKANAKVRLAQYDHVVAELVGKGQPTIFAGDLNTITPGEGPKFRRELAARVARDGRANSMFDCSRGDDSTTFSAALVVHMRIDWMLLQSGEGELLDCPPGAYRVFGAEGASDHKPVVTTVTIK